MIDKKGAVTAIVSTAIGTVLFGGGMFLGASASQNYSTVQATIESREHREELDEQTYMTCWYGAQQFYTARGIDADESFDLAKRDCDHAKATLTEDDFNMNFSRNGVHKNAF